tara:strand:- start:762 stop:968 length:207 start_codon:yes stop_codon:yes gene_type:complete
MMMMMMMAVSQDHALMETCEVYTSRRWRRKKLKRRGDRGEVRARSAEIEFGSTWGGDVGDTLRCAGWE